MRRLPIVLAAFMALASGADSGPGAVDLGVWKRFMLRYQRGVEEVKRRRAEKGRDRDGR